MNTLMLDQAIKTLKQLEQRVAEQKELVAELQQYYDAAQKAEADKGVTSSKQICSEHHEQKETNSL